MADATPSRIGSALGVAGTKTQQEALFLKVFSGEVLTAFNSNNIFMDKHTVRTIGSGKSASFSFVGDYAQTDVEVHTAGNELLGNDILHNEKVVTIDGLTIAHTFIASIDEAMNHFDVRSQYSTQLGHALSKKADAAVSAAITAAASNITFDDGTGADTRTRNVEIGVAITGTVIADQIFAALAQLDAVDATGERYVVLDNEAYWALFTGSLNNLATVVNKDAGGSGSVSTGQVPMIGGAKVYRSNNMPAAVKGQVFTKEAAATVKLKDLSVEAEYDIRRQGTLLVAKYAMGHSELRPSAAVQFKDAV